MAGKKKSAKKKAAATPEAAAGTRCEQGGDPIEPILPIRVAASDRVMFQLFICKSGSRPRVYVDGQLVAGGEDPDEITYLFPALSPGLHLLYWSVLPTAAEWQTRAEVRVNQTVAFRRRRKKPGDNNPTDVGFVYLEATV
jgi:hypothetical protein